MCNAIYAKVITIVIMMTPNLIGCVLFVFIWSVATIICYWYCALFYPPQAKDVLADNTLYLIAEMNCTKLLISAWKFKIGISRIPQICGGRLMHSLTQRPIVNVKNCVNSLPSRIGTKSNAFNGVRLSSTLKKRHTKMNKHKRKKRKKLLRMNTKVSRA